MNKDGNRFSPIGLLRDLLRNYFYAIFFAAVAAMLVRMYVAEAFKIPTDFMAPTLLPGDHIFVNKLAYGGKVPERGDVIIFSFPNDLRKEYIKRVVAIGGDTIEIRDKKVLLNGTQITAANYEEKLDGKTYNVQWTEEGAEKSMISIQVPAGKIFVLGDFRSKGQDSRNWGFIDPSMIKARASFIWFSFGSDGDGVRWDRLFRSIQ